MLLQGFSRSAIVRLTAYLSAMLIYCSIIFILLSLSTRTASCASPGFIYITGFMLMAMVLVYFYLAFMLMVQRDAVIGKLSDTSMHFAVKLHAFIPREERYARKFFAVIIPDFVLCLKKYCIPGYTFQDLEDTDEKFLPELKQAKHIPYKIIFMMTERINRLYLQGALKGEQLALLVKDTEKLSRLQGKLERTGENVYMKIFSVLAKGLLGIYVLIFPFVVFPCHLGQYAGMLLFLVMCLVLLIIAEEMVKKLKAGEGLESASKEIKRVISY